MAKKQYIGIGGVARQVKKQHIGVGGVARKIKKGYVGVSGVARPFFSGTPDYYWFSSGWTASSANEYNWYTQTPMPTPYLFHRAGQTQSGVYNQDLAKALSVAGRMDFNPSKNGVQGYDIFSAGTTFQIGFSIYAGRWYPRYSEVALYGLDRSIGSYIKYAHIRMGDSSGTGSNNVTEDGDLLVLNATLNTDSPIYLSFDTKFQRELPSAVIFLLAKMVVNDEVIYYTDQRVQNPW